MRTICEVTLNQFKFWAGAIDNRNRFSYDELEQIEAILEDCYPEGIDETDLNDQMWFEPETFCEWLNLNFEEWEERPDDYYKNN